ncbi:MAG: hypothetical protein DRI94_04905 [Bacteroidetes bacterium]|nr:MAG: hypothetical protein DRI94_04905 [Bacteroidota bacterium]
MKGLKYIYKNEGEKEAVIIPIEFWKDLLNRFNLKNLLKNENYFYLRYKKLLSEIETSESKQENPDNIFSLFGTWQSDKTGDELSEEIYSLRNDNARHIEL